MKELIRELYRDADVVNELLARYGVRFGIYKNGTFKEQLFPFDMIPRIIQEEEFYYLELKLKKTDKEIGDKITIFNWERNRIFEKIICFTILEKTLENKTCKIISVQKKEKKKYRPFPLNTVEMTKLISRKLHINSKEAMDIAEKLYRDGLISYPRTETQRYKPTELSGLRKLVEDVQASSVYGAYCNKLLTQNRYNNPKIGSGDDKAHPPIHPVRYAENNELNAKEKKVYDLIMRHFLATLSPDAKGQETTIRVKMGEEFFRTKGLIVEDKGYLEIYTFDYWSNSYVPNFSEGEVVVPYSLNMEKGITSPPNFLTEAELIGLMDKNGIGTDATIHEHIKHVQDRGYAKQYGSIFKPTLLGTSLRYGYLGLGIEIYKPYLRAGMEREIKEVSEGFTKFLLPFYSPIPKGQEAFFISNFVKEIRNGQPEAFMKRLESLFADGKYQIIGDEEKYFHNAVYLIFKMLGFYVDVEYMTSDGRIDLLIRTKYYIYIIEFKVNESADAALKQIEEKQYELPFAFNNCKIFKIGINFSTNTRKINDWTLQK